MGCCWDYTGDTMCYVAAKDCPEGCCAGGSCGRYDNCKVYWWWLLIFVGLIFGCFGVFVVLLC